MIDRTTRRDPVVVGAACPDSPAVRTEVDSRVPLWTMALRGGRPMASLDEKEGRLAEVPDYGACVRAWESWRRMVRKNVNW